jgi:hypothetical protein
MSCHGLVVMDATNETVRLAHFTAQEYLNRKGVIPQNSDTSLAIACTTYLSFDEFKNHNCQSLSLFTASAIHTVSLNTLSRTYHLTSIHPIRNRR